MAQVSPVRLYILRAFYLIAFVGGLFQFWPKLVHPAQPLGLYDGVSYSYWVTLMTLMGLGVRYPLQMAILPFMQLTYKGLWFLNVALPLWMAGKWDATLTRPARIFAVVMIVDAIVIPWGYMLATYVKKPGDSWKLRPTTAA